MKITGGLSVWSPHTNYWYHSRTSGGSGGSCARSLNEAMKSSAALLRIPAPRLLLQAVIRWLDLTQAKHDPVGCHPGRVVHCLGMIRKQLPGMEIGQQVNFKPQVKSGNGEGCLEIGKLLWV